MKQADASYADYEPTIAARAIQDFVVEDLSNWYVRLNRRRFWKGEQGRTRTPRSKRCTLLGSGGDAQRADRTLLQ
jgi:isoleucyl-tRNA synthetase